MYKQMKHESQEEYCFKWSNYPTDVANIFLEVLHSHFMVDVTICAQGHKLHAHRIVLSACSPYLQEILSCSEDTHPVIILSDISFDDIQSLVEFMYQGEINVGADRIKSVLNTAEELQIRGLMGLRSHFNEKSDIVEEMVLVPEENIVEQVKIENICDPLVIIDSGTSEFLEHNSSDDMGQTVKEVKSAINLRKYDEKKRRCRRKSRRKDYSEESLVAALEELKAGRSLVGTAVTYHIPRSTLYVRARAQGIQMSMCRQGHAGERVQAAIKAVTDGASLQKAAEQFKIPKTVLWRNVHKHLGTCSQAGRTKFRKPYDEEKRRAAIQALEKGDNLSRVSHRFQIPKTTLFREKARLVETGRLPWSSLKRRGPYLDGFKKNRLSEAVAACKDGKMSQALASVTFQVPKTTIWRRLQEDGNKPEAFTSRNNHVLSPTTTNTQVDNHIPVTYLQTSVCEEESMIIVATSDSEKMTNEENSQIIFEASASDYAEKPQNADDEITPTSDHENVSHVDCRTIASKDTENTKTVDNANIINKNENIVNEDVI